IISSSTAGLNSAMWTDNLNRMKTVPEFRERIKDAAYRVILAKLNYFKGGNAAPLYPDAATIYESIPDKEGQKFFMDQACRSITLYKKGSAYPLKASDEGRVLIAGPFLSLYEEGRKRFPNADTFHYSYELADDQSNYSDWNAEGIESVARRYDTIIVTVYDWHTANIARRLQYLNKRVIIFSILSPVYVLDGFEWADTILFGYSYSSYSFAALWGALHGEFTPSGIVPLSISNQN
ncbi:MAG: glycoside hydrolase family 3 protein, partial [Treponema sp.]|nr:glycoside hydrolase family 3 protein [Treponema sp.]